MMNDSPPGSPDPPTASELVTRAESILRDCMAESSIANLNTAIYLLAQTWGDHIPQDSQCLNLFSTALLTRFSYTGEWEDVKIAGTICACLIMDKTSGLQAILRAAMDSDGLQVDEDPADVVELARSILAEFHQSVNKSSLDSAICLYEEAISGQDSLGIENSRTIRQLANAYLIQFRNTNDTGRIDRSVSLL
ncbi:hypothetical protein C8R44DRAFT_804627, partial [Mycena epipterygia]